MLTMGFYFVLWTVLSRAFDFSIKHILVVILGVAVLFIYQLYTNQEKLLYQPQKSEQSSGLPKDNPTPFKHPLEQGLAYENIYLQTRDGERLHAWWIPQTEAPETRPTLLWFHANAGNMGLRLPNIRLYHAALGVNIFILSYRGYGESSGSPSEEGLIIDAETALTHVLGRADVDKKSVVVFGRSLGGAVAIALTNRHQDKIRALILENTFTSISELVDHIFPFLRTLRLKDALLRLKWPSMERIASITVPILFLSSEHDEVVPAPLMRRLFDSATATSTKRMLFLPDCTHNDAWIKGGLPYLNGMRAYLELVFGSKAKDGIVFANVTSSSSISATSAGSSSDLEPEPKSGGSDESASGDGEEEGEEEEEKRMTTTKQRKSAKAASSSSSSSTSATSTTSSTSSSSSSSSSFGESGFWDPVAAPLTVRRRDASVYADIVSQLRALTNTDFRCATQLATDEERLAFLRGSLLGQTNAMSGAEDSSNEPHVQ